MVFELLIAAVVDMLLNLVEGKQQCADHSTPRAENLSERTNSKVSFKVGQGA